MRLPTGKFHLRALAGSGAKVNDLPTWTGTEWKPGAAATLLGVGEIEFGFPSDATAGGAVVSADFASLSYEQGNLDVSVSAGGAVEFSVAQNGIYLITQYTQMSPVLNVINTDIHKITFGGLFGNYDSTHASTWAIRPVHTFWVWPGNTTGTPWFGAECNGGTNRTYHCSSMFFELMRFAFPT